MGSRIQSSFLVFLLFTVLGTVSVLNHAFCFDLPNPFSLGTIYLYLFFTLKNMSLSLRKELETITIISIIAILFHILHLFNSFKYYPGISLSIKPVYIISCFQMSEVLLFVATINKLKKNIPNWAFYPLYFLFFSSTINSIYIYINAASIIKIPLFTFVLSIITLLLCCRFIFLLSRHHLLTGLSCFLLVNVYCVIIFIPDPIHSINFPLTSYFLKSILWFILYRMILAAPAEKILNNIPDRIHPENSNREPMSSFFSSNKDINILQTALSEILSEHQSSPLLSLIVKKAVLLTDANEGELGIFDKKNLCIINKIKFVRDQTDCTYNYDSIMNTVTHTKEPLISNISPEYGKGANCYTIAVPLLYLNTFNGVIIVSNTRTRFSELSFFLLNWLASHAAIAITNVRQLENTMRQAQTDSLTGLYNHRHFFELAKKEISRAQRYKHPLTALMFDIDYFKLVNDTFGHQAGDLVLIAISNLCRKLFRNIDIVCRYGGEEFAVLLPETPVGTAREVADRLRYTIQKTLISYHRRHISVTISLGLAPLRNDCTSIGRLIERADTALYHAKADGRNRIIEWKASMCHIISMKHPKVLPENVGRPAVR